MQLVLLVTLGVAWPTLLAQSPTWKPELGFGVDYEGEEHCRDSSRVKFRVIAVEHSYNETILNSGTMPDLDKWSVKKMAIMTMGDASLTEKPIYAANDWGQARFPRPICISVQDATRLFLGSGKDELKIVLATAVNSPVFHDETKHLLPEPVFFRPGNPFKDAIDVAQQNDQYTVSFQLQQRCPIGRFGYLCQKRCSCDDKPCSVDRGICPARPFTPPEASSEEVAWWIFVLIGLIVVFGLCCFLIVAFCIVSKILKKKRAHRSRHHDSPSTEDESKEHRSKKHKKHKRKQRDPTVSEEAGGTTDDIA
ncbi:unnamed protein product, partial [Mesorhabditis spiculigera]